jgi:hypothetical protein
MKSKRRTTSFESFVKNTTTEVRLAENKAGALFLIRVTVAHQILCMLPDDFVESFRATATTYHIRLALILFSNGKRVSPNKLGIR